MKSHKIPDQVPERLYNKNKINVREKSLKYSLGVKDNGSKSAFRCPFARNDCTSRSNLLFSFLLASCSNVSKGKSSVKRVHEKDVL